MTLNHQITKLNAQIIASYNDLKYILESKKLSLDIKIRLFNNHIESVFLYNSELWTMTKKLEETGCISKKTTHTNSKH